MDSLVPIHSEFETAGFQPYVLDLQGLALDHEDTIQCLAFVVLIREGGCLLALPEQALPDDALAMGLSSGPEDLIGPFLNVQVKGSLMSEADPLLEPTPAESQEVGVVLVDFNRNVATHLIPVGDVSDLDGILLFDNNVSGLVPTPEELVIQSMAWAAGPEAAPSRIHYYSADEVPETPVATVDQTSPQPARPIRRKARDGGTPGGGTVPSPKKRPTVASLAESLEAIQGALPMLTAQLQDLSARTAAMEGSASVPQRASALRRPLAAAAIDGLSPSSTAVAPRVLFKENPPPKGVSSGRTLIQKEAFSQEETENMNLDLYSGEQPALAQAVLEQSKALTALVSQMATGDHLDFTSSSSSLSSKGAMGRAKLQSELAQHKGIFFQNVIQNMSRRMYPSQSAEVELSVLHQRGVLPSLYLERFGGYGKCRDYGMIQWQIALVMNLLMEENWQGAKDSLALLFVCMEQSAMDGKMDIGLLLALVEDPPQTVFSGRSLAATVNPRPFAPTASQRWATVALQYLKELDVLSTRRREITGKDQPQPREQPNPTAKPSPKKKGGKGAAKAKASQDQEEA